jgi:FkbM family methyltransferase
MDLYGQDAELRLLSKLLPGLGSRTMIDVGAERGSMAEQMLRAGVEDLYAFDPHPDNASALRTQFASNPRVRVYEHALSDGDGSGELHISSSPDGRPVSFGHTLLERDDTHEIAWRKTLPVKRRSLGSLINAAEIPSSIGILKIDTEGHDLAVVRGMGALEAEIVMVEHWTNLPNSLGACPWTTQEMVAALHAHGFTNYAFIVHRGEFVSFRWNNGDVERGAMGNLVFLHDRVLQRLLPALLDFAGWLAEPTVSLGQRYMRAAAERLALVDELKQAADDRLALVHELEREANSRLNALEITTAELKKRSAEVDALSGQQLYDRA